MNHNKETKKFNFLEGFRSRPRKPHGTFMESGIAALIVPSSYGHSERNPKALNA